MSLPKGWIATSVGEIASVNPREFTSPVDDDDTVSFLPMPAIEETSGHLDLSQTRKWAEVRKGFTRFEEGDVLFAKITPSMENGKITVAQGLTGGRGAGTTELHVFRPTSGIQPGYLRYFLLQESVRRYARVRMTGTAGQLRVPASAMEGLTIPLPPLPEQRRIVEAIETRFTRLDAAVKALQRVRANLKRYRASVLKAAFSGRLVPTKEPEQETDRVFAREDSQLPDGWVPTSIGAISETKVSQDGPPPDELFKYVDISSVDNSLKGITDASPTGGPVVNARTLPSSWMIARIDQVGRVQMGRQRSPNFQSGRFTKPYLRAANILDGKIDTSDVLSMDFDARDFQSYNLRLGDVLVVEGGSVGRSAVYRGGIPDACFQNTVIRFQPDERLTLSEFADYLFRWYFYRGLFKDVSRQTTIAHLGLTRFAAMPYILPPLPEQRRIVEALETRFSVADEVLTEVQHGLERCVRLRESILKTAFAGRLVPQDPSDEPATVLLEKIGRGDRVPPAVARRRQVAPTA